MKKYVFVLVAIVLIIPLTTLPVNASIPMVVSGEFSGTSPPSYNIAKMAGSNVFLLTAIPATGYYSSGPIVGTYEQYTDVIWHFGNPETVKNLPADLRL